MSICSVAEIWRQLRASSNSERAGEFRIQLLAATHGVRVFAAVAGHSGRLALVVDVPEVLRPARFSAVSFRRIRVALGPLRGLPPGRAGLVLELDDDDFEDLFGQLVDDIIRSALPAASAALSVAAVSNVLVRWQRFLENHTAPLSDNEVRGLVGELVVLDRLAKVIGASRALSSWKSPRGSIRDFETGDRSIEVKTCSPSAGNLIRINDPLQLEADPGLELFLACQPISRSDSIGSTLQWFVETTAKNFAGDVRLSEEYEEAVAGSGFLGRHAHLYPAKFSLGELLAFRVAGDFPRLSASDIAHELRNVEFSIPVAALARYSVPVTTCLGGAH